MKTEKSISPTSAHYLIDCKPGAQSEPEAYNALNRYHTVERRRLAFIQCWHLWFCSTKTKNLPTSMEALPAGANFLDDWAAIAPLLAKACHLPSGWLARPSLRCSRKGATLLVTWTPVAGGAAAAQKTKETLPSECQALGGEASRPCAAANDDAAARQSGSSSATHRDRRTCPAAPPPAGATAQANTGSSSSAGGGDSTGHSK